MNYKVLLAIGIALGLGVLAFVWRPTSAERDPGSTVATRDKQVGSKLKPILTFNKALGINRPAFKLPDAEGKMHDVSEWDGKVLVVNFWATWCPPCRREMPLFVALQEQYGPQGLQFVGIALDDVDAVRDFADGFAINYPILIGDNGTLKTTKLYGNHLGALPYTAIIDRKGRITYLKPGELRRHEAEPEIKKLL